MRVFAAAAVTALMLALFAASATAASPKVEAAIRTIRAVAADPNLQKTFCALLDEVEKMGDKEDPQAEASIGRYLTQLGANFQAAWEVIEDVDDNSPDEKAVEAALDELGDKCP